VKLLSYKDKRLAITSSTLIAFQDTFDVSAVCHLLNISNENFPISHRHLCLEVAQIIESRPNEPFDLVSLSHDSFELLLVILLILRTKNLNRVLMKGPAGLIKQNTSLLADELLKRVEILDGNQDNLTRTLKEFKGNSGYKILILDSNDTVTVAELLKSEEATSKTFVFIQGFSTNPNSSVYNLCFQKGVRLTEAAEGYARIII
jgi:hypothetical protein